MSGQSFPAPRGALRGPVNTPTLRKEPGGEVTVHALEQTIAQLEHELLNCHRLAMLGSMAAMITHEFRNILAPTMTLAADAAGSGDPERMKKVLAKVVSQIERAISVAHRLMNLGNAAGDQAGEPVVANVADALREAIEDIAPPLHKSGVQLTSEVAPDLSVRGSAELLTQVLLNLLLNAREAMRGQTGPLHVGARRELDMIVIDVRDSGRGIAVERLTKIINPFLADAGDSKATDWQSAGLGLNVCRMITRRFGASIQGAVNKGPGCTFTVRWPAA